MRDLVDRHRPRCIASVAPVLSVHKADRDRDDVQDTRADCRSSSYQHQDAADKNFPNRRTQRAAAALSIWVDLDSTSKKENFWKQPLTITNPDSLAYALLHHLQTNSVQNGKLEALHEVELESILAERRFTTADVEWWAWILSGDDPDMRAERFLTRSRRPPLFLLLEILRAPIQRVDNLKGLILETKSLLLNDEGSRHTSSTEDIGAPISWESSNRRTGNDVMARVLLDALLEQARRISPPAIVSIAQLIFPYMIVSLGKKMGGPLELSPWKRSRLCSMYNTMLLKLSAPAKIEPFYSMVYNAQAQRILLESGNLFEPPFLLNCGGYKSIIRVLIASKKIESETKAAGLRARTWPPWRVEQDGMDAQRPRQDDMSRALLVLLAAQESGYDPDANDVAMRILAGQELDGTPTVQKRTISHKPGTPLKLLPYHELSPMVWAARIEATRDIEEAWSAFSAFSDAGGQHDQTTYAVMLEKLIFERLRATGIRREPGGVSGDAKEQLPPNNDKYSAFYRSQLQPPTFDMLYRRMLDADIKLPTRLVALAVETVADPIDAMQYLADAGAGKRTLTLIKGGHDSSGPQILSKIPKQIFAAIIGMLGRFAPRAALKPISVAIGRYHYNPLQGGPRLPRTAQHEHRLDEAPEERREWVIVELSSKPMHRSFIDPLHTAAKLLLTRKNQYRPAWYRLFETLARSGLVHNRRLSQAKNDILSWRVMKLMLSEFQKCGLELDPEGFCSVAWVVRKAVIAESSPSVTRDDIKPLSDSHLTILKSEFRKLTRTNDDDYLPRLWNPIRGYMLHAYMLALGPAREELEMVYVLNWMVDNHRTLNDMVAQAVNGHRSLRYVFVAARIYLRAPRNILKAQALVDSVPAWGGWPDEQELEEYVARGLSDDAVTFPTYSPARDEQTHESPIS
ncbi:hypothetical protein PVAG01_03232 [Phlyctema vagabunda]|uniref:Uncharacterized protein n=1 Tax=Phlyctema vagabunda TaxID=108571 RepID=A0ABR4PU87_9HELO